jgi:hypothetical protein
MLPDVYHATSPLASFDRDGITDDPLQHFCSLLRANTLHKVAAHITTNHSVSFHSDSCPGGLLSRTGLILFLVRHPHVFLNPDGSEIDPVTIGIDQYFGSPTLPYPHSRQGTT